MPTILVCEADEGVQEAFRLLLEDWATAQVVPDTTECLNALRQSPVELLILDLDGQGIEPLEVLTTIRATYPTLKVLLVAGGFTLDFQLAALKRSPISFLTKPFNPKATVEKIQTLVGYATSLVRRRSIVRVVVSTVGSGITDVTTSDDPP